MNVNFNTWIQTRFLLSCNALSSFPLSVFDNFSFLFLHAFSWTNFNSFNFQCILLYVSPTPYWDLISCLEVCTHFTFSSYMYISWFTWAVPHSQFDEHISSPLTSFQTLMGNRAFLIAAPHLWNYLPLFVFFLFLFLFVCIQRCCRVTKTNPELFAERNEHSTCPSWILVPGAC